MSFDTVESRIKMVPELEYLALQAFFHRHYQRFEVMVPRRVETAARANTGTNAGATLGESTSYGWNRQRLPAVSVWRSGPSLKTIW
jgi:hypothetical protein